MVLMVSFGLFIPIIAPGDDVKHLVPSLLADAKELKFPRPSRTWPLPCADAACFRVHFNLVDPVSTNDEPKLFYQTKDYSEGFFLIGAFHRMCAGMRLACETQGATLQPSGFSYLSAATMPERKLVQSISFMAVIVTLRWALSGPHV